MPSIGSTNSLFSKTTKPNSKLPIPAENTIPTATPLLIKGKSRIIRQIAIPEPPPNRTYGRFVFEETSSLSTTNGTGLISSTSRGSTGSRGSTASRGSGSSSGSLGSEYSKKKFSGVSKASRTSRSSRSSRSSGDSGVSWKRNCGDEERNVEDDRESNLFFLKGNPLLDSYLKGKGKARLKFVMDERSYTSLAPSPTPSLSPNSQADHQNSSSKVSKSELKRTPKLTSNHSQQQQAAQPPELTLSHLTHQPPKILFQLLTSFHTDILLQNHQTLFSTSQLVAVEEFLSYASTLALVGSNDIEGVGVGGFEVMRRVCDEVVASDFCSNFEDSGDGDGGLSDDLRRRSRRPWLRRMKRRITGEDRFCLESSKTILVARRAGTTRGSVDSGIDISGCCDFSLGRGEKVARSEKEKGETSDGNSNDQESLRDIVQSGLYDLLATPSPPPCPQTPPQLPPHPAPISFSPSEITQACNELLRTKGAKFTFTDLVQAEREVVQHALAWKYLVRSFVVEGRELSEEMIRGTHEVLMFGIAAPPRAVDFESDCSRVDNGIGTGPNNGTCNGDDEAHEHHAGLYRTVPIPITADTTTSPFPSPPSIPRKMRTLISDINRTINYSIQKGEIDPIALAAEFCHRFVCLRPFLDGNGRVARLLGNAVLMRWVGVVVDFGGEGYLGIVERGRVVQGRLEEEGEEEDDSDWDGNGEGDQGEDRRKKLWAELATFMLRKCVAVVEGVWDVLCDEDVVGVVPGWEELLVGEYLDASDGEELDWKDDDVLEYYFDGQDEQRVKDLGSERGLVIWPNPPPKIRQPAHVDVLKTIAIPDWILGRLDLREGGDEIVGEDESPFSLFERKAASLMAGRGFMAQRVVEKETRLSGEHGIEYGD
ncbi:hypothetical protein BKA64DRAFT_718212 [Cadophora sp. MPI-SDFR-AT-0126]|nr:hypothetical protein BKA64DRAFT_718212 [Leotiomycetes sp. MPI-SDFR-AT-0126]